MCVEERGSLCRPKALWMRRTHRTRRILAQSPQSKAYLYGKRDLFIWQKRPVYMAKATHRMARESECCMWAYLYGKRDLRIWQKRPTYMGKETHRMVKESPSAACGTIYMAKETCVYGKRDLRIWEKRPIAWQKRVLVLHVGLSATLRGALSFRLLPHVSDCFTI